MIYHLRSDLRYFVGVQPKCNSKYFNGIANTKTYSELILVWYVNMLLNAIVFSEPVEKADITIICVVNRKPREGYLLLSSIKMGGKQHCYCKFSFGRFIRELIFLALTLLTHSCMEHCINSTYIPVSSCKSFSSGGVGTDVISLTFTGMIVGVGYFFFETSDLWDLQSLEFTQNCLRNKRRPGSSSSAERIMF